MKIGAPHSARRLRDSVAALCLFGFLLSTNGVLPALTALLSSVFDAHEVRIVRVEGRVDVILAHHDDDHTFADQSGDPETSDQSDRFDPDHQDHIFGFAAGDKIDQARSLRTATAAKPLFAAVPFEYATPLLACPSDCGDHAARPPPLLSAALLSHRTIVLVI